MSRETEKYDYDPDFLPQAPDNPFRPGPGGPPPTFAGRRREKLLLDGMAASMKEEKPKAPVPILFYGPRGFGKTCFLKEVNVKYEAEQWVVPAEKMMWWNRVLWRHPKVKRRMRVVRATASKDLQSVDDVVRVVLGVGRLSRWLEKLTWGILGGSEHPVAIDLSSKGVLSKIFGKKKPPSPYVATSRLTTMCRKEPVIMLVDEAHTIDLEAAKVLLNIDQDVRQEAPFFLVMSGTPGTLEHLTKADVSFVHRSEQKPLPSLSPEEARDALVGPFESHKPRRIKVDPGVVKHVVKDSECFPYFVQLWGRDLWNSFKAREGDEVNMEDVKAASRSVDVTRRRYYRGMYRDIEASTVLRHATFAVASALRESCDNGERMTSDDGQRVVRAELARIGHIGTDTDLNDRAREIMQEIVAKDFMWQPDDHLVPGIPSFISYIVERGLIHDHDPDHPPPPAGRPVAGNEYRA